MTHSELLKKKRDELEVVKAQIPDSIGFGLIELEAQEKCLTSFISKLEGLEDSEWISVDDRLPDNYDEVICCDKRGEVKVCKKYTNITDISYRFTFVFGNTEYGYSATHWQPLPSPPIVKPLK